jgi:hypothetical protein
MARSKRKQTPGARRPKKATASPLLKPMKTGMPALDSITGVEVFGKGTKRFQIIHTNEVDEYEKPPRSKARRKKGSL